MEDFMKFKKALQNRFSKMQKNADHLYEMDVDKDILWNTYLDSFPAGTNKMFRQRREYDCSCCRQFIKNIGAVIAIKDGKIYTLWEEVTDDAVYRPVCEALNTYVKAQKVKDVYISEFSKIGTDYNFEEIDGKSHRWDHFF